MSQEQSSASETAVFFENEASLVKLSEFNELGNLHVSNLSNHRLFESTDPCTSLTQPTTHSGKDSAHALRALGELLGRSVKLVVKVRPFIQRCHGMHNCRNLPRVCKVRIIRLQA